MCRIVLLTALLISSVPASVAAQSPATSGGKVLTHPLFALCVGTHDARRRSPAAQAKMLKELGYAGMAHLWLDGVDERLQTLDRFDLRLFQVYIRVSIDPRKRKYDPRLKAVIRALNGRDTILGLLVQGESPSSPAGDARAVEIIREIAELAKSAGLRVALYPHTGDWLERVEDAVRVVRKVDRENVGVMFNLCHWLKVDRVESMKAVLALAMPHLFVVTINGADPDKSAGWDRLIQPLDRGSFDLLGFLKTLNEMGYTGPIGLQCYGIAGDARDHLKRSMAKWRELCVKARD